MSGSTGIKQGWNLLLLTARAAPPVLLQAMETKQYNELIGVASEIKACVRRGLTLADLYGTYSTLAKVATLVLRKSISNKFDRVCALACAHAFLECTAGGIGCGQVAVGVCATGDKGHGDSPVIKGTGQSRTLKVMAPVTPPHQQVTQELKALLPPVTALGMLAPAQSSTPDAASKPLGRNSLGSALAPPAKLAPPSEPAAQGLMIKSGRHDRVYCMCYVPLHCTEEYTCIWWSAGGRYRRMVGWAVLQPRIHHQCRREKQCSQAGICHVKLAAVAVAGQGREMCSTPCHLCWNPD